MSGHSKWANIKHKKARSDEKRGKEFTKVAKEITIAVKSGGGGDPESNAKLKLAIQKAKSINMPNENITRAIKKGTGEIQSEAIEEFCYEGYAPAGVAVMLDIATDNRNRTAPDIRHLFSKHNGNLGESGCVSWMFKRVGLINVDKANAPDEEELMLMALECGADDVRDEGDSYDIITGQDNFLEVKEALENTGIAIAEADLDMLPETQVEISDVDTALKIIKLIDLLEDHDDVQKVYTNMNLTEDVLDKLS
ncbi:MAG TPA: YebC/PmpR family DNA-binding transcriptional regulator [Syntrophomonas sp.]|jgi:YebC/PmpR family DNA-binding regulatory protein|nr:YebC/PmpR family DNA-binding transcriptional regulator [Syntrophomonas sp.]